MSTHDMTRGLAAAAIGVALLAVAGCTLAPAVDEATVSAARPQLGRPVDAAEVARWNLTVLPNGEGLPPGSGTARQGQAVYAGKCQNCHGEKGSGKPADPLAGGIGSLASKAPLRTVGSFWPYATTLFDYVRRAMPLDRPLSLTDAEVYGVTAYVLYVNGLVGEDAVMDAKSLPAVRMPNRDGFVSGWPARAR